MPTITARRLRMEANVFSFDTPRDKANKAKPALWASNDYRVEVCAFAGAAASATLVDDLANIASATLELKTKGTGGDGAPDPDSTPLASQTITEFNGACTYADWVADTDQHMAFELSGAELDQDAGDYWLVISLETTDGKSVTLLAGLVTLKEDGTNSAGSAPVVDGTAYTKAQSDARYVPSLPAITGLTGGGSTKLDGLATAASARATGSVVLLVISDELQIWRLEAGTDAEASASGIVRPDDYDGSTNARVWKRRL